jgi:hypothetical protein
VGGNGVAVGPGVVVAPGAAGGMVPVGEAARGGGGVGGRVGNGMRVALGEASATDVGAGPVGDCEESKMPASTVATETRATAIPLNS